MVFCNPVLVLHVLNGFISLIYPDTVKDSHVNTSVQPHLDVHAHDGFCRLFTLLMVGVQSALYSSQAPKITFPAPLSDDEDERDSGAETEIWVGDG